MEKVIGLVLFVLCLVILFFYQHKQVKLRLEAEKVFIINYQCHWKELAKVILLLERKHSQSS